MEKLLTKDDILNAQDCKTIAVKVPEWGGEVLMKSISGSERDSFEASVVSGIGRNAKMNMLNLRAKLVSLCVVNDKGQRLFSSAEEVAKLGRKNGKVLDRLFRIGQSLSGLSDDAVKELSEGLEDAQSEGSTSG